MYLNFDEEHDQMKVPSRESLFWFQMFELHDY